MRWAMPDEPGPVVLAVRDEDESVWTRDPAGWRLAFVGEPSRYFGEPTLPWDALVIYRGPLTDCTAEFVAPDGSVMEP